jgi:hypothetical protein
MISGGFDRNVIVLDIEKLSIVKTFKGHNAAVTQVGATKYVYMIYTYYYYYYYYCCYY